MTLYFALLRGINVSGHNMIKMTELKRMFEEMGFARVQTYINSGNVLFESEEEGESLEARIEQEISSVFGLTISVMVRSESEWKTITATCPFSPETLIDKQSIHLTLLKKAPTQEELDRLPDIELEGDEYLIDGREIYVLYRRSSLDSKLTKKFQKLVPATSRNWKTVIKLAEMAKALETKE
ncbi:DUF1697 domain-containing protein [Paenibacillus solisilvae]|uniref:DUF1697 domain-containing protein n=1 Tax=Paenibacillus solisilvae TaxID=2486751 RepID=A0ABW0VUA8_9BACL